MRKRFLLVVMALAVLAGVPSAGQVAVPPAVLNAPLSQVIPVDPKITTGKLPNGLRYYIRANTQPDNRAELRLVVNAGSILEDDDQLGLAHFVEHMAFNGTAHFPDQNIVAFMQAVGMRFGAHVNAHTSFDETVYELQIPTDDPTTIERSFLALEDWAHNVTFDPVEIDKERGVILEERRLGLGADFRLQDQQFPVMLKGSRYADRMPIGKPEILQNFTRDKLTRFYSDWYRPDLMAVIAVGDFDPAAIEARIRAHFGPIPSPASPRPRPSFDVPDYAGTLYAVATDPEATATTVSVISKMAFRGQSTVGAYRQQMLERLFSAMLGARFDEIAQKPDAPFLQAQTRRGMFVRTMEATSLNAAVTENGIERGLAALFTEADRIARFGFTPGELERVRLNVIRFFQQAVTEREAEESGALADEYIRNFAQGEPIPGIVYEYGLNMRFLPEITLTEINTLAKNWTPDRSRVVVISAPRKPGVTIPDEKRLAAVMKEATGGPLTAYVDSVDTRPLLERTPAPGKIVKASTKPDIGITEWELSNGLRVVLKPTTFKQDEILFRAVSPGGTSLAADEDFIAADTANEVISEGGLGRFSRNNLDKRLAGKTAGVRPQISEMVEGLRGGASRNDLETMFQLIYLSFTEPRADAEVFRALTGQLTASLANQQSLPEEVFNAALAAALTQDHPRARPMTPAMVTQMNLEKSLAFYKDRFADASDFTFVFVGSFDPSIMAPLVERYLASLPAIHRQETPRDVGIRPPAGIVEKQVVKGIDPKAEVSVVFTGTFQNDLAHRVLIRAMGEALGGNLQRTLREDLGGTYGVGVAPEFRKGAEDEYRLNITFGCDPARTDILVKALFQEVEDFRRVGPSAEQMADVRTALGRDFETNIRENVYLLNQITSSYQNQEDVADVFNMRGYYDRLTPSAVRDAARMYLNLNRYVKVTLLPEVKAQ